MGIVDWLGFLAGRKASIERVANVRGLLWLGLLFVGSAALAREYDAEFIPYNPVVLAVPLIASTAAALLLFLPLWFAARRKGWPGTLGADAAARGRFWPTFGRFLGIFWLTAPMAWLYGFPWERILPELEAAGANLWTLAVVAVWRVGLMVRVAQVLFGFRFSQALVLVLFFADVAALAAVFFAPWPVMEMMGGVRSSVDDMLGVVRFFLGVAGVGGFLVLLLPFLRELLQRTNQVVAPCVAPSGIFDGQPGVPSPALWALAVVALVAWAALLPFTQPPLAEHGGKRVSFFAALPLHATGPAEVSRRAQSAPA